MPEVRAMCAIGRRGQLGLNGRMPCEGARGPEYTADVQRFFELTRGHVILLGPGPIAPSRLLPTRTAPSSRYAPASSRPRAAGSRQASAYFPERGMPKRPGELSTPPEAAGWGAARRVHPSAELQRTFIR